MLQPITQSEHASIELQHALHKIMRGFGRQCRGQGKVFVKLVRQTEKQLLEAGHAIAQLASDAQQRLDQATQVSSAQGERLASDLSHALHARHQITKQSRRLTQGKRLSHCKIVNAYDPTIAPILKGKSNCPAQFGRKPGILSEPSAGYLFAIRSPLGNPSDVSYVMPLLDRVDHAIQRCTRPKPPAIYSLAGDLGVNDPDLRQTLHERGILTVGIPKTIEPIEPQPTPEEILSILNDADLNRKRTPYQVQLACACGYSRPARLSHKKFTRLSNASNLLGQSAKSSSAS